MKRQLWRGASVPMTALTFQSVWMNRGPTCSSSPARSPRPWHRWCANQLEEDRRFPRERRSASAGCSRVAASRAPSNRKTPTREIRLVVPVSDPVRWGTATATLKKSLDFLTGDQWTIGFRARPARFATIAEEAPPSLICPPFDSLSLFSGGLDSLIGAIDLLEDGATPLLVSHFGEGATSDAQGKLLTGLKKHYDRSSFERLRVGMTFDDGLVEGVGSENSTREDRSCSSRSGCSLVLDWDDASRCGFPRTG